MMDVLDVHHSFDRIYFGDVAMLQTVYVDTTVPVNEIDA